VLDTVHSFPSFTDRSNRSLHSLPNPLPASLTDSGRPFHIWHNSFVSESIDFKF
jgi:hypothetical protein